MKPFSDYGETITSGSMPTGAATIELTPEMFTLLSDGMYQDKILAPIRESICNARDAHVEKGVTQALEVHVPNRLEPYFHVRDFGTGLSERQVLGYNEEVQVFDEESGKQITKTVHVAGLYLRYGKSTKRDDNLQIGGFGIGCKSPLAYSDSFIVESVQDGLIKTYTIYKEDGIPRVAKLSEKVTNDPTGLKVKIAVASQDTDKFVTRIADFLRFFNYDVVTTGASITYKAEYVLQTPAYDTVRVGFSDHGRIKASMGGVLYKLSDKYKEELEQVTKNHMMIMKFEIGDLSVAGSRETLSENSATVATLDLAVKQIKAEFFAVMRAQVEDKSNSVYEALGLLRQYDLIRSDWALGKQVTTKAAADFTIGGVIVNTVIDMYDTRFRIISASASWDNDVKMALTAFREVPIVLELDKGTGYLKVARQLSRLAGRSTAVALVSTDDELQELKDFFGEDNLTIEKVSVKYPEFFPKGVTPTGKVKVVKSGIFSTVDSDIRELDEGQEGYYIPFERMNCVIEGAPAGLKLDEFDKINQLVKALIEAGELTEDEVFYSRKSGLRAIKKTNLKELNWDMVEVMCSNSYSQADYKAFVRKGCMRYDNPATGKHSALEPFWLTVKHDYPTFADTKDVKDTSGVVFLGTCGIVSLLEDTCNSDVVARNKLYSDEAEQFTEDYPVLDMFGSSWWRFTDEMVRDLVSFCEWKMIKKMLEEAAA